MCVIHLVRYLGCGHYIPDVEANVNNRCDAVSAALVFYHDQPSYQPLNEPLVLPRTCPAVRMRGQHIRPFVLQEQAKWDQWMVSEFERNGFDASQRINLMHQALGPIGVPQPNPVMPYPINQVQQYNALITYQNRENKAPNVVYRTKDGVCRRGSRPGCGGQPPPAPNPSSSHSSPHSQAGDVSETAENQVTNRKPSSSLQGSGSGIIAGDDMRRTRSAMGLEQIPDRTAATATAAENVSRGEGMQELVAAQLEVPKSA